MDHDPMQLNTPGGIITLDDGKLTPPDPAALCTKTTPIAPDFNGECPRWLKFLGEVTNHDEALVLYLQRLAGYCLTGLTREQHVTFIWGDGKNGKSVFLNVLEGVLGDYAKRAPMDTFTASNSERHSTDIAGLHGARLVSASETAAGKRWDEPRLKNLSGGEPVTARFMRQDNFTYMPQFKLVFIGNHKPELRSVGEDMRRRLHLIPFTFKPAVVDRELPEKLRAEYPAILAWMIRGCLAWQAEGLAAPPIVKAATDDYFSGEDAIGDWMRESLEQAPDAHATTEELFLSWREWSNRNNEYTGSKKRLASTLIGRGIPRWQDTKTRKMGFDGVRLVARDALLDL
jgi:putative DNA primase/helicase